MKPRKLNAPASVASKHDAVQELRRMKSFGYIEPASHDSALKPHQQDAYGSMLLAALPDSSGNSESERPKNIQTERPSQKPRDFFSQNALRLLTLAPRCRRFPAIAFRHGGRARKPDIFELFKKPRDPPPSLEEYAHMRAKSDDSSTRSAPRSCMKQKPIVHGSNKLKLPGLERPPSSIRQVSGLVNQIDSVEDDAFFTTQSLTMATITQQLPLSLSPLLPNSQKPLDEKLSDVNVLDAGPVEILKPSAEKKTVELRPVIPPAPLRPKKKKKDIGGLKTSVSLSRLGDDAKPTVRKVEPATEKPLEQQQQHQPLMKSEPNLLLKGDINSVLDFLSNLSLTKLDDPVPATTPKKEKSEEESMDVVLPDLVHVPTTVTAPKAIQEASLRRHKEFMKTIKIVPINETPVIEQITYDQLLGMFRDDCTFYEKRETNIQLNELNEKSRRLSVFANIRIEAIHWEQLHDSIYNFFRLHKLRQEHVIGIELTRWILQLMNQGPEESFAIQELKSIFAKSSRGELLQVKVHLYHLHRLANAMTDLPHPIYRPLASIFGSLVFNSVPQIGFYVKGLWKDVGDVERERESRKKQSIVPPITDTSIGFREIQKPTLIKPPPFQIEIPKNSPFAKNAKIPSGGARGKSVRILWFELRAKVHKMGAKKFEALINENYAISQASIMATPEDIKEGIKDSYAFSFFMTKEELASKIFLEEGCHALTAAALEFILVHINSIFNGK
ncbi:hypothetical protein BDR26DRAFT_864454 [Obelidium mucronatum]|nr:hypothetical protein BDR26DRAFT_864454 [Obelidium mucronatum]